MKTLHVAVGVIEQDGRYLLTRRRADAHEGGRWEFPGGKLEREESPAQALSRELYEELGIEVLASTPLIDIPFRYPQLVVHLHVRRVDGFRGMPTGREGQPLHWYRTDELSGLNLPAANRGIIGALLLPRDYLITPEPGNSDIFLAHLEERLAAGLRIVQLRSKRSDGVGLLELARQAAELGERHGAKLILNASPELAAAAGAHGVHLSSARVYELLAKGAHMPRDMLVGASCHDAVELQSAQRLGVDYLLCSPVRETPSHPGVSGMGWARFAELCAQAAVPVYALGGVGASDCERIRACGGHGAAGISAYWGEA